MQKRIALPATLAILLTTASFAQMGGGGSKPSPAASATCDLGGKTIKTDYSSPRIPGRQIYGGLVPFAEVCRTCSNDATTFVTTSDLMLGVTAVPAGT